MGATSAAGGGGTAEGGAGIASTAEARGEDTSQLLELPGSEQDALSEGSPGDGTTSSARRQSTASSRGPFYTPAPPEALIDARECRCCCWVFFSESCWQPWALLWLRRMPALVCGSGIPCLSLIIAHVTLG